MLVLDIEAADPDDRALIDFFIKAHSAEGAVEGWRLALWCPNGPPAALSRISPAPAKGKPSADMAVFGWPGQGQEGEQALVPVATVQAHPELVEPGQQVVLARRELPPQVFALLLNALQYEPDLEKQLLGWWYDLDDELPDREPPWRPTGALLPRKDRTDLRHGERYLVLVEVDDCWFVLSERALRTYAFGARLADEEPLYFVVSAGHGLEVWTASAAGTLDIAEVEEQFGPEAAERAREDAACVLVTLSREPLE